MQVAANKEIVSSSWFSATLHLTECGYILKSMATKDNSAAKDFPIVCVGGSAGGLDAYIRLLQNLPADMGVAIVIV
jgi:chemotaxis response regulator CheB